MNQLRRLIVWLSRIHRCQGFGIQSPTDYAFVRYVVNEHWPYYAYESLKDNNWLTQKMGRLYFRMANWRQPTIMLSDCYQKYWQAGCKSLRFDNYLEKVQLARVLVEDRSDCELLLTKCDERSVLVVPGSLFAGNLPFIGLNLEPRDYFEPPQGHDAVVNAPKVEF